MTTNIRKMSLYLIVTVLFCFQISTELSGSANAECLKLNPNQAPYFPIPDKHHFKEKVDHPLIVAAWMGKINVLDCWLKKGTIVDIEGFRGDTALMRASMFGHAKIINKLLEAGADVNKKNEAGQTALHFLAHTTSDINLNEVAKLLIDAHIDVNIKDHNGETALKIATTKGITYKSTYPNHYKLLLLLINNGANIEPMKDDPWSPFLFAILHQEIELVHLLLKQGADPNTQNHQGQSALDIAETGNNKEIIQTLKKAGARTGKKTTTQPTKNESDNQPEYKLENEFIGKKIFITPEGGASIYLSRSPESWFKDDLTILVKANTQAEVLETRVYRPNSSYPLHRFKVKTIDGEVGWVSLLDLLCTSFLCDDDHPQRRFPFDI